jgi:hypothetical protein
MAVWFVFDIPMMSSEQADAVIRELNLGGKPPTGQIFHVEAPVNGGTKVVDVWESEEAFGRFFQEQLLPAFQRAGVQMPPDARPQFLPARNILK